jgi:hypothetical protein
MIDDRTPSVALSTIQNTITSPLSRPSPVGPLCTNWMNWAELCTFCAFILCLLVLEITQQGFATPSKRVREASFHPHPHLASEVHPNTVQYFKSTRLLFASRNSILHCCCSPNALKVHRDSRESDECKHINPCCTNLYSRIILLTRTWSLGTSYLNITTNNHPRPYAEEFQMHLPPILFYSTQNFIFRTSLKFLFNTHMLHRNTQSVSDMMTSRLIF